MKTFLGVAQRKVFVDEYGDPVRTSVPDEIDRVIDKILVKEGIEAELDYSIEFLSRCQPDPALSSAYSSLWLFDELSDRFIAHDTQPPRPLTMPGDTAADSWSGVEFERWLIGASKAEGAEHVSPTRASDGQGADVIVRVCANVKRWHAGDQRERWVGSGLLVAEKQFRKVQGHKQIPILLRELEALVPPNSEIVKRRKAS